MRSTVKLAIVVPVYGNELSLRMLYERIVTASADKDIELTIQFVNDRSPDNSQAVLEQLAQEDPRVRVLLLSKNHGSFIAIVAGLHEVKEHDAVIIMAADLQDPPELIPEMLQAWRQGKPVVLCVRRKRADALFTKVSSYLFHALFRKFVMPEMPSGGFDFCLIDRRVMQVLITSSEKNTSLIGLILWAGFERAYLYYDRAERQHGQSMWSFRKKVQYAINSIIAFSAFPLKLVGLLGIFLGLLCLVGAGYAVINNYLFGVHTYAPGWSSLVFLILVLGSFQLIGLGILGEYFWNNLEQTRHRPLFIVDRRIQAQEKTTDHEPHAARSFPWYDTQAVSRSVQNTLIESCSRVLRSDRLILGQEVRRFERELAAYLQVPYVVGVGNGTDALTLALLGLGIQPGDTVVTTSISAPATAVAILRAGAEPVFVDVDPVYLTISPHALEQALSYHPKALIPVHLYGNPCEMKELMDFAETHQLTVVEDCAQSFGSTLNGVPCGSVGKAAAFSFYPTKNLGGYGDGGAIATSDAALAERLYRMRFYGQNADGECIELGLNSRLDELQAALLLDRLKIVDEHNAERQEIARQYDCELGYLNPVPSRAGRVPHLYVVRPPDRPEFRAFLLQSGIQTGVHYALALPSHTYLQLNGIDTGCPLAMQACETVVSLPCYPGMSNKQIRHVIDACHRWKAQSQK